MTWPLSPESAKDLPSYFPSPGRMIESLEIATPGISIEIAEFSRIANSDGTIEKICEGDPEKEMALASLLITLAYRIASASTPEEVQDFRRSMSRYEHGQGPGPE